MVKIVTLSGWGQPHDSLNIIAPNAHHFDYSHYANAPEIFENLARVAADADLVIGWSLGGQLAARAIAQGLIKPRKLALIAAPYQFVKSPALPLGMRRDLFDQFRDNLATDPERTLKRAWALVAMDDAREAEVAALIRQSAAKMPPRDWLKWLDELSLFSCHGLDLSKLPPTLLVQGGRDRVVFAEQAQAWAKALPDARLELWEAAGHAPHLHHPKALKALLDA